MKQSERLYTDAGNKQVIIDGYRKEIDLRAGQIDKLNREITEYDALIHKEQINHDEIIKQAQNEEVKEKEDDKKQKQQMAMSAAQNLASGEN